MIIAENAPEPSNLSAFAEKRLKFVNRENPKQG